MKSIIAIIAFVILSCTMHAQDIPSQKILNDSESEKIVTYLKIASSRHDSLLKYQNLIRFAEIKCEDFKGELLSIFNHAEIEMLKILGRYGFNPDIYTIMIKVNDVGEIQLHIVKKSDVPVQQPEEKLPKPPSIREP